MKNPRGLECKKCTVTLLNQPLGWVFMVHETLFSGQDLFYDIGPYPSQEAAESDYKSNGITIKYNLWIDDAPRTETICSDL
jgi:hypothetical protein